MRARIREAAIKYKEEIESSYPEVTVEVMPQTMAGADVWVRVRAPLGLVEKVLDLTVQLNDRWESLYGVAVLATVSGTGPAPVPSN